MSTYAFNMCRHLIFRSTDLRVAAQYRPDNLGETGYGDAPPRALPGAEVRGIPQSNEVEKGDFEADIEILVNSAIREFGRRPFDVVHAQYAYPCGVAAIVAAREVGVPAIVSMQGGDGHWFGECCAQHTATLEWILGSASRVLFPTVSFQKSVQKRTGLTVQGSVLGGGVDTSIFRPNDQERKAWRARLGIGNHENIILYHGRLDNRKGLRELINGFANLDSNVAKDSKLIIAGAGPDAESLRLLAEKRIGQSSFQWLGHLPYTDMAGLLAASDLHCSPTYQEGFSNTLVEAAAVGVPLLTTDAVGVRDVFQHNETAWLIPIKSAFDVSHALKLLIENEDLRLRLSAASLAMVSNRYSWELLVEKILDEYSQAQPVLSDCPDPPLEGKTYQCRYRVNPLLL